MSFQSANKAHGISNREAKGFLFLIFLLITPFLLQYGYRAFVYMPQPSGLDVTYLTDTCYSKKEFVSHKTFLKPSVEASSKKKTKAVFNVILELNAADSIQLESLPGIGPTFAARILKYRKLLGGYVAVEQLKEVYGIPEETYLKIKTHCIADRSKVHKISAQLIWENPYKVYHPYLTKDFKAIISNYKGKDYSNIEFEKLIQNQNPLFFYYIDGL